MSATFEVSLEMADIIEKLRSSRTDLFGWVRPHMILCGLRTDKPQPESQTHILKIEGVRGTKVLLNEDVKYIISGYESKWETLQEIEKIANVANMLVRIDYPTDDHLADLKAAGKEFEWGKLVKPDVVDYKAFLKAFGLDWNELGTEVPNVLDKNVVATI